MNELIRTVIYKWKQQIAMGLLAIASLWIVYTAYQNYLFFFSPLQTTNSKQLPIQTKGQATNYQALIDNPLFGLYIPNVQNTNEIPSSNLNLKLIGVMLSDTPTVIIELMGDKQKIYHLNDSLPGNAKIIRILANEVLIERNGIIERLSLPKDTLQFDRLPPRMDTNNEN